MFTSLVTSLFGLIARRNMPQHGHKKPFSTKQKKKQLQMKREKKKGHDEHGKFIFPCFELSSREKSVCLALLLDLRVRRCPGTTLLLRVECAVERFACLTGFEESKIVERHRSASRERSSEETSLQHASLSKLNQQPTNSGDKRYDPNRFVRQTT